MKNRTLCNKLFISIFSFFLFAIFISPKPSDAKVYVEPSDVLYFNEMLSVKPTRYEARPISLNYPTGTEIDIQIRVGGGINNDIKVWILDKNNLPKYFSRQAYSYYVTKTIKASDNVKFQVPYKDTFYIIFDNTFSIISSKNVIFQVTAHFTSPRELHKQLESGFDKMYLLLKETFIFPDFDIAFKTCGQENAFSDPNITICYELINDCVKKDLPHAITWVFMHELGHSLLRLWDLPTWDNEDTVDEFATVMFLLGENTSKEGLLQAVEYWSNKDSSREAQYKLNSSDRHELSVQRARNIKQWANNSDDLLRRWMNLLIPHMQTRVLLELKEDPKPWVNLQLITKELEHRGVKSNVIPDQNDNISSVNEPSGDKATDKEGKSAPPQANWSDYMPIIILDNTSYMRWPQLGDQIIGTVAGDGEDIMTYCAGDSKFDKETQRGDRYYSCYP